MNLDNLNKWLSLLSNLGVVLGLVFLGIEIRQSSLINEATVYQNRISQLESSFQSSALSDYIPVIQEKLETSGIEALDPIELRRLRDWETARIYRMQGQWRAYSQGLLDENSYDVMIGAAGRSYVGWERLGILFGRFDPAFLTEIARAER